MKRMKIFIVPMLLLLILYTLCSCGGNVTVTLGVIIYIYKDNSNSFTADELKRLRITSNGMVAGDSLPDGTNGGLGIDENGNHYRILNCYLGYGPSNWWAKKIRASYKSKIKKFHFTIEDTSGVYETFTMNPLDDTYEIVDETIPVIKYTVILKKK